MMQIRYNNQIIDFENKAPVTLAEFLKHVSLDEKVVTVILNEQIVKTADYDKTILSNGDHIDVVELITGG